MLWVDNSLRSKTFYLAGRSSINFFRDAFDVSNKRRATDFLQKVKDINGYLGFIEV